MEHLTDMDDPRRSITPAAGAGSRGDSSGGRTAQDADTGRLLISCADRPGIIAAVSTFLHQRGANIIQSDQYSTGPDGGRFFQRLVFRLPALGARLPHLEREFVDEVAGQFGMEFQMCDAAVPKRLAILVSCYDHCLLDLLWRWRRGELPVDIRMVVSNHPDLAASVSGFGVPYEHVPVTPTTRDEAEKRHLELLHGHVDLVVLARYMQILSGNFLDKLGVPIINIHHSFLPAFAGAQPYWKAKQRGVKLIGATAHYVTEDLDQGPIIEQDVIRVSHRENVSEFVRLGADIERTVLARAVAWHSEDRVLVDGNTAIVL